VNCYLLSWIMWHMGIHKSIFICQAQCALQMYNRRPIGTPKILQFSTRDCLLFSVFIGLDPGVVCRAIPSVNSFKYLFKIQVETVFLQFFKTDYNALFLKYLKIAKLAKINCKTGGQFFVCMSFNFLPVWRPIFVK